MSIRQNRQSLASAKVQWRLSDEAPCRVDHLLAGVFWCPSDFLPAGFSFVLGIASGAVVGYGVVCAIRNETKTDAYCNMTKYHDTARGRTPHLHERLRSGSGSSRDGGGRPSSPGSPAEVRVLLQVPTHLPAPSLRHPWPQGDHVVSFVLAPAPSNPASPLIIPRNSFGDFMLGMHLLERPSHSHPHSLLSLVCPWYLFAGIVGLVGSPSSLPSPSLEPSCLLCAGRLCASWLLREHDCDFGYAVPHSRPHRNVLRQDQRTRSSEPYLALPVDRDVSQSQFSPTNSIGSPRAGDGLHTCVSTGTHQSV